MMELTTKEAISYLLSEGFPSYYAIAKYARDRLSSCKLQPTQVSNYHTAGVCMSEANAHVFLFLFGIEITDAHRAKGRPSVWGDE